MSYYRFLDRVSGRLGHFSKDTDGAIAAFSVVTFLTMFLAVGMATDFMRHEAQRAELQDALDRGVLAAAMSNTEAEAGAAVAGYLRAANFISSDANLDVDPDFGLVSKRVNATIEYPINTFFLKLAGIPQLNVVARSSAATSKSKIEISLALDISGSMSREDTAVDQATFIGMNPDAPTPWTQAAT